MPNLTWLDMEGAAERRNHIHTYSPPAPIKVRQNTSGTAESEISLPKTPVKPNTTTVAWRVIWA